MRYKFSLDLNINVPWFTDWNNLSFYTLDGSVILGIWSLKFSIITVVDVDYNRNM